jgi:hypothetical protein
VALTALVADDGVLPGVIAGNVKPSASRHESTIAVDFAYRDARISGIVGRRSSRCRMSRAARTAKVPDRLDVPFSSRCGTL